MKSILSFQFCLSLAFPIVAQNNTRPDFFLPAATSMRVNSYAGNLFYERQDIFVPGRGLNLDLTFYYNSSQQRDWGYGFGWSNIYNIVLEFKTGAQYVVTWGDGRQDIFVKQGNDFIPPSNVYHKLEQYEPNKYRLTTKHGLKYFFEGFNRVSKIEDRNGNTLVFTYNQYGINNITDPSGRVLQFVWQNARMTKIVMAFNSPPLNWDYTYNNKGNLEKVTNPLGGEVSYYYGIKLNNLALFIDEKGSETHITYRTDRYVESVTTCLTKHEFAYERTDTSGETVAKELIGNDYLSTTYEYDSLGRNTARSGNCCGNEASFAYLGNLIAQSTDANGHTYLYEYDSTGNVTKITDPESCEMTMTYDPAFSQVLSSTDKNGNTTTFSYDVNGNLTGVQRPLGVNETYAYDAFGNQTGYTDGRGNTTTYIYNNHGYLTQINHPVGSFTTQFTYDSRGNKLTHTDANGHATTFAYDLLDRLTQTTDPLGAVTLYEYDARGNKTKETNALGNVTTYDFDPLDRLIKITAPLNTVTQYAYDSRGNLVRETDPRGSVTTYKYDSRDFLTSQKDPLGYETAYAYDGNGNQISVTDANGNATLYFYDALNRLEKTEDALGFETEYAYDCNGNPLSVTDANGNATTYAYDALNRQTAMTDAMNFTTNFEYDANNNLTEITDAKGNPTAYEYDALNRKTKETFADNTTKIFTYDGAGNVTSRKDNAGNMTFYTYDAADRLTLRNYPDANDDLFTYDALDRMTSAVNQNATVTFTYDALNRMLSETLNDKTTGYNYNIATGKRTLIYPSGRVIEENYDLRSQLAAIKESGETLAAFAYDPAGRMTTRSYGNGTVTTYAYDDNNRTTGIVANPGEFIHFTYAYDNVGNKRYEEKKHHPTHSEAYGYDANYRLTEFKVGELVGDSVPAPLTQTVYNYDGLGNRTTVTSDNSSEIYSSNSLNQYTQVNSNLLAYDANGNLTANGDIVLNYNSKNQLLNVNNPTSGTSTIMKYDALGRRIQKTVGGNIVDFFYDEFREIENSNPITGAISNYIYQGKDDKQLVLQNDANSYFSFFNDLNSVVALVNDTGLVNERYEYQAFGIPIIFDQSFDSLSSSQIPNDWFFTGRKYDEEFGQYYYRYRDFNPHSGRFLQFDPLMFIDGLNLYVYGKNNPINLTDAFGTKSTSCCNSLGRRAKCTAQTMLCMALVIGNACRDECTPPVSDPGGCAECFGQQNEVAEEWCKLAIDCWRNFGKDCTSGDSGFEPDSKPSTPQEPLPPRGLPGKFY